MNTNAFYDLWLHKQEEKGRVNVAIFFVNIFLILCHFFFLVIFILVKHNFMVVYNFLSCILYICMLHDCYRKPEIYVGLSFLEILIYMILCIFAFGLDAGFQIWPFAVITASFLPAYKTPDVNRTRKMSFAYSIIVVTAYVLFYVFRGSVTTTLYSPLNPFYTKLLFIFNSSLTFFSIIMFALFFSYKSQRREFELTRKADHDELTNLYNRYAISELHSQVKTEALHENKNYNIGILDIDFFKRVNDTYGHNSGDLILKDIANMLKLLTSKSLIPGRWGGEEFILLAPSSVKYKEFLEILRKLNLKVSKTKFKVESGEEINLTISIGAATIPPGLTVEEAIGMADRCLYEAKETGRNKVIG